MARQVFHDLHKTSIQLILLQANFSQICIEINQDVNNPTRTYQKYAIAFYDESKINLNLEEYILTTINNIDARCPDYKLALTSGKKECIVVYSIIQKLLEGNKT